MAPTLPEVARGLLPRRRVLSQWIAPTTFDSFSAAHLRRTACAQPSTAKLAIEQADWGVLEHVLRQNESPADTIVCARGNQLALPAPRDLDELRAYMRMGIGLCVRHTQRCHPKLAAIGASFEDELGRPAQVQLFVTPGGTHGFGWHYDAEDVFIAQSIGVKDYYFRQNTVEVKTPFPPRDFSALHRETSVLRTATLVPGDFLYLPARWWHMAIAVEDTLSISVGVLLADS